MLKVYFIVIVVVAFGFIALHLVLHAIRLPIDFGDRHLCLGQARRLM